MLSNTSLANTALLRPGSVMGVYPQREDVRNSFWDKCADTVMALTRQYFHARTRHYSKVISKINHYAHDLDRLSDAELNTKLQELRKRLFAKGLGDNRVFEAFAIIREVADRQLGLRYHDVQLIGGWCMLRGNIAEMETGEGKTLTATLPACIAALAGIPVHIVTVNDFLVTRDAQWMHPIYKALGLSVGTITEKLNLAQRRAAYQCDVVYCTNKQIVFDYLKDRLLLDLDNRDLHLRLESLYKKEPRSEKLLMRGLCFAIVDEADSVLVDEARTPLIISSSNKIEQEEEIYKIAIKVAKRLSLPRDFTVDTKARHIDITDFGRAQIATLTQKYGGIWKGENRRTELVHQALSALHLYVLDKHYLVTEGRVQIIDEYSGRVMGDRAWERGLHQMVETKEGCQISGRQETLARMSYQKYFRRYLHLAGMTGTAKEVAGELSSVYHLKVNRIPTNKKVNRIALREQVFVHSEDKWLKIIEHVKNLHAIGRPILIGTRTVGQSEYLSELLTQEGLEHSVLNARQDQEEANIISVAGQRGRITVATNMAGRGTDIKLPSDVVELGGLHVIATERHDAGRIDRQLFGRCGRQGDPGSYQAIVSLDDEIHSGWFVKVLRKVFENRKTPLPVLVGAIVVFISQTSAERNYSRLRKLLLTQDTQLEDMLAFGGRGE